MSDKGEIDVRLDALEVAWVSSQVNGRIEGMAGTPDPLTSARSLERAVRVDIESAFDVARQRFGETEHFLNVRSVLARMYSEVARPLAAMRLLLERGKEKDEGTLDGVPYVQWIIGELLSHDLNDDTRADLQRWAMEARAGKLSNDDEEHIWALHTKICG